jgi:hypothetical protein
MKTTELIRILERNIEPPKDHDSAFKAGWYAAFAAIANDIGGAMRAHNAAARARLEGLKK